MNHDLVIDAVAAWAEDWCGVAPSKESLESLREMIRLSEEAVRINVTEPSSAE